VRDHDLAEMAATFEMALRLLCLGERERPVDHGVRAVHRDRAVHRLKMARLPTLIEPSVIPRAALDGLSIVGDRSRSGDGARPAQQQ
jgi:hypothetical protein